MAFSLSSVQACSQVSNAQRQRPSLAFGSILARPTGPVVLRQQQVAARVFGSDDEGPKDKKFISRDEEPEEYWSSKGERAGANPMQDPLAYIGILAIFFPFILLLLAIAAGYIDLSVYK